MPKPSRKPKSIRAAEAPPHLRAFAPKIENQPIEKIRPDIRNARVHSEKQLGALEGIVARFGLLVPILIDEDNVVLAGHARLAVAKRLGMTEVPTIRISHLTKAEKRAYVIADNKIATMAGWDDKILAGELKYLVEVDADFDVTITGFETAEIDILVETLEIGDDDAADLVPAANPGTPVTQLGDLWSLGPHRLLCGSASDRESYSRLLDGGHADMGFNDPPFNVPVNGHVSGLGRTKHREFVMGSGEMSDEEYERFLTTVFSHQKAFSRPGAINFVCIDWRHVSQLFNAANEPYGDPINLCVWVKSSGGLGSLYRSQHELIAVLKSHGAPHVNNVQLGRMGRYRTNTWQYAGVNSFGKNRAQELAMHPTVKPVALVMDAIKDVSNRGDIVLDCFMGSGTTLVAAEKAGRHAYGMELDPIYVDTAIRRWQDYTGGQAIHVETGVPFCKLREVRHG